MIRICGECSHFKEVLTCDGLAMCSLLGLLQNEDDLACSYFDEKEPHEKQGGE